jgi:hypothetical protein
MPELAVMYAIPNGGLRSKAAAGKLKAEGVKAGVPDICLPLQTMRDGALYIELKAPAGRDHRQGRVTPAQAAMHASIAAAGNRVVVACGWEDASRCIESHVAEHRALRAVRNRFVGTAA